MDHPAARAWRHGLPESQVGELLPALHAAPGWIADSADRDGDGFVEYFDDSGAGLANRGWKDSGDAVRFAGGAIADGPVALVEVQGHVHEALLAGAELLEPAASAIGCPSCSRASAPTRSPSRCPVQAWSAAVPVALLAALLGLDVDVARGTLTLRPPRSRSAPCPCAAWP